MNCLFISKSNKSKSDLFSYLKNNNVRCEFACDQMFGIQKLQQKNYDAIVLDVFESGLIIDSTIQIIKKCNPHARIIVRAEHNTKELEARVRKQHIFFYHVKKLGEQEFRSALASALKLNKYDAGV